MSKEHIDGQTQKKHELDKTHEFLLVLYEIRLLYAFLQKIIIRYYRLQ
jgi:hypothetical protein